MQTFTFRCSEQTREAIEDFSIATKMPPSALARTIVELFLAMPQKDLLHLINSTSAIRTVFADILVHLTGLGKLLTGLQEYRGPIEQTIEATDELQEIVMKREAAAREKIEA